MKMVPLNEVLTEYRRYPGPNDDLPVLTLTEKNGFVRQSERFNKRLATDDTSKYKIVGRFDLAFNPYLLWAGALAQNTSHSNGVISPLYPTFKVDDRCDPSFVYRFLLTPEMIQRYDSIAYGSVPRRRRSSVRDFLALEIPAPPPLDEQRRIATILDKADAIRRKHRQAIAHLDTLTQSVFQQVSTRCGSKHVAVNFGDAILSIGTGSSPKCESRPAAEGEWGVLKLSAVTSGVFTPSENKAFLGDPISISRHEVKDGDILMTRKNTPELVGAMAIAESPPSMLAIPDLVFRVVTDTDLVIGKYLQTLLMSPTMRNKVRELAGGSAKSMSNISIARLKLLLLELPELHVQEEFVRVASLIDSQRKLASQSFARHDALFASLQSRAFRGEL